MTNPAQTILVLAAAWLVVEVAPWRYVIRRSGVNQAAEIQALGFLCAAHLPLYGVMLTGSAATGRIVRPRFEAWALRVGDRHPADPQRRLARRIAAQIARKEMTMPRTGTDGLGGFGRRGWHDPGTTYLGSWIVKPVTWLLFSLAIWPTGVYAVVPWPLMLAVNAGVVGRAWWVGETFQFGLYARRQELRQ